MRDLRRIISVVWLHAGSLFKHLEGLGQDRFTAATVAGKHPRHVVEEVTVLAFVVAHRIDELVQLLDDLLDVVLTGE